MCHLRNIAMRYYQENATTGQTDRQMPDKVISMCRYASQATQKDVFLYYNYYSPKRVPLKLGSHRFPGTWSYVI